MPSTPRDDPQVRPDRSAADDRVRQHLRLLFVGVFLASFDRLVISPLLLPIAGDLDVPAEQVGIVATGYFAGYGLTQVIWGFVSDRLGRVRTIRIALAATVAAGVATVLASGIVVLAIARFVAGVAFAAIVPGTVIYIGDSLPVHRRHGPLTDLTTVTALGTAAATLVAAAVADVAGWRMAFALPTTVAAVIVLLLGRITEPASSPPRSRPLASLAAVLLRPWPVTLLALIFVEGMVLLGVLTYLPPLLQQAGMGTTLSGLVTAGYGVAIMLTIPVVKLLARRGMTFAQFLALGGTLATGAYCALLVSRQWPGVLVACVLLAGAWAFMHTTLQTWITDVAPTARATAVSLFASSMFLGSAAWTAVGARPVASGRTEPFLLAGIALCVALTVVAAAARRLYTRRAE